MSASEEARLRELIAAAATLGFVDDVQHWQAKLAALTEGSEQ